MPRLAAVLVLLVVSCTTSFAESGKVSNEAATSRTAWFYVGGTLRKGEGINWRESNSRTSIDYLEVDRTDRYVELYDKARKQSYRLYHSGKYVWNPTTRKWHLVRSGRWDDPAKKPLDPALNSHERVRLYGESERASFPKLGDDFEVLAPASDHYNCIAWALGNTRNWVWPNRPDGSISLADFDALFAAHGYQRGKSLNFDRVEGYDKLVLYAKYNEMGVLEPTHGARQLSDGSWSSKLGKLPLIRHLHPEDVEGSSYGSVRAVYVRARATKQAGTDRQTRRAER